MGEETLKVPLGLLIQPQLEVATSSATGQKQSKRRDKKNEEKRRTESPPPDAPAEEVQGKKEITAMTQQAQAQAQQIDFAALLQDPQVSAFFQRAVAQAVAAQRQAAPPPPPQPAAAPAPAIDPMMLFALQAMGGGTGMNPMMLMALAGGNANFAGLQQAVLQQAVQGFALQQQLPLVRQQVAQLAQAGASPALLEAYAARAIGVPFEYRISNEASVPTGGSLTTGEAVGIGLVGAVVGAAGAIGTKLAGWW